MQKLENKIPLKEQEEILSICMENGISLTDVLTERGYTYDSLRYADYPESLFQNKPKPSEKLEDAEKLPPSIPAISFFSGAGGLDIGFEYAGFNNVASIEANELCCNTLRKNSPDKFIIGPPNYSGDIRNHEEIAEIIEAVIGTKLPFEGVFHGGPPCQSFSVAANQRFSKDSSNFKRKGFDDLDKGELLFDYLWYIKRFQPTAFLIENVAGITECDADKKAKKALDELSEHGYSILSPGIINTAYYGVPQNRMRWLIIGTRKVGKPVEFPSPNDYTAACYDIFTRTLSGTENHQTREHSAQSISRYMQLAYGARDRLGRVDRLNPYTPSKTVIAGGTKGGGRSHLHPYTPRTISVRECARLQTFPDSYVFTGATARQFTQVGNAVPPLLAYKIANHLRKSL